MPRGSIAGVMTDLRGLSRHSRCRWSAARAATGSGAAAAPRPWTPACVVTLSFGIVLPIPISATLASSLAPTTMRGRYMGLWTLMCTGGYALGPPLGGWALDTLGGRGSFLTIARAGLLGAALLAAFRVPAGCEGPTAVEDAASALGERLRGERPVQAI